MDMSDIVLNMAENMIKYSNSYSLSKYDLVYEGKPELFDFEQLEEYIWMENRGAVHTDRVFDIRKNKC